MSMIDDGPSAVTATVHRVDKCRRPRLAFNYELRSPSTVRIDEVIDALFWPK